MQLIDPSVHIYKMPPKVELYADIASAARKCYQSEGKSSKTDAEMVSMLVANGHGEILEMGDITVDFIVGRDVSHQLVRHRHTSKAQESQRYVGGAAFITPHWYNGRSSSSAKLLDFLEGTEKIYKQLREDGLSSQQARAILPNCTKTEIRIKTNIRDWRNIFKLRTALGAYPEIRDVMVPLLEVLVLAYPELFGDIKYPNEGVKRATVYAPDGFWDEEDAIDDGISVPPYIFEGALLPPQAPSHTWSDCGVATPQAPKQGPTGSSCG